MIKRTESLKVIFYVARVKNVIFAIWDRCFKNSATLLKCDHQNTKENISYIPKHMAAVIDVSISKFKFRPSLNILVDRTRTCFVFNIYNLIFENGIR